MVGRYCVKNGVFELIEISSQLASKKNTYPSLMCMLVVGSDVTVPLLIEREPVRVKKMKLKFLKKEKF